MLDHGRENFHSSIREFFECFPNNTVLVTSQGFRGRHSVLCSGAGAKSNERLISTNRDIFSCFDRVLNKKIKDAPKVPYIEQVRAVLDTELLGEFYFCNIPKWFKVQHEHWYKLDLTTKLHHPDCDMH